MRISRILRVEVLQLKTKLIFAFGSQEHLLAVQTLSSDVEKQEVLAGEIRSCVNIPDAKRIWQRLAALQIRRSETEDRLGALILALEEQQDWPKVYAARFERFVRWAGGMEQRLQHRQRALLDDVVQRLSGPLKDELSAKELEKTWLVEQGTQLSATCGDQGRRDELLAQVVVVQETWRRLTDVWQHELDRLKQLPTDLDGLNASLGELAIWLGRAEASVNTPLTVPSCSLAAVEAKMAEHEELERSIDEKRPIVASVLELCESFSANSHLLHGWLGADLDAVQYAMQSLDRRWKSICSNAADRATLLRSLWPDWSELACLHSELDGVLSEIEEAIPRELGASASFVEVEQLNSDLERVMKQLHAHGTRRLLDELSAKYCQLARSGRVDTGGELQELVSKINARWRDLSDRLSVLLHSTRDTTSSVHHWQVVFSNFIVLNCFLNGVTVAGPEGSSAGLVLPL